jgi:hypothetical protein
MILAMGAAVAAAAELRGKVTAVTGRDVRIEVDGDLVPQVGDRVLLSFRIPGGPEVQVGEWRVSAVSAEGVQATVVRASGTPTVGQTATIDSASPTRRQGVAQARPPGNTSPGSGAPSPPQEQKGSVPPPGVPGPSAPSPFPRRVSIVRSPLIVGPLPIGGGRVEHVGPAYRVFSSAGLATWKPISREPAQDLYATIRARVQRGSSDPAVVGLLLSTGESEFNDGDLFFGKIENEGLVVQLRSASQWVPVPGLAYLGRPVTPGTIDQFEVTRQGGIYQLRANGQPVATLLDDPGTRAAWVHVFAGSGNAAEFFDWRVERPE